MLLIQPGEVWKEGTDIPRLAAEAVQQMKRQFDALEISTPVMVNGTVWVATGTWQLDGIEISSNNSLKVTLAALWMNQDECIKTLREVGQPKGFSPQFKLPHQKTMHWELLRAPVLPSFDEHPRPLGEAAAEVLAAFKGVPPEHHLAIIDAFTEELKKLGIVVNGNTHTHETL